MNFAISSYSKHPKQAFDAAMCLRSPANELKHAENGNEPPVLQSLYNDPRLAQAYPTHATILQELQTAVPRPVTPLYQNISTIISSTLSPPSGINPASTTKKLKDNIQQAIEGKGILP
jgi:multiple sugar transport system substrate-binding protein